MSAAKTKGLHHITIQTVDWEASLRLYRDVLGMTVAAAWGPEGREMALLDVGDGSHIELVAPKAGGAADAGLLTHLALASGDVVADLETVRAAGYEVTMAPKDVTLGEMQATVAFFKGPNGESIEFFQTR